MEIELAYQARQDQIEKIIENIDYFLYNFHFILRFYFMCQNTLYPSQNRSNSSVGTNTWSMRNIIPHLF